MIARAKGSSQGTDCDFASRPATKGQSATLESPAANEFLTRSNDNQQRVPHSFRRASRTFQIRNPRSGSPEGQATNVLSEHRNKEQRKRTQQRSATMFAVYLLCVLGDTLCLTPVMGCAHMDDHRACRVTSVHTLSTTTKRTENN